MRYLTCSHILERVGPTPKTFLFVCFGEKTSFFEVTIQDTPVWAVTTEHFSAKREKAVNIKFLREKKTTEKPPLPFVLMSVSSEDKQSTRESWPDPPRAEMLIQEQEKALKMLQRQVKDLQGKLNSKSHRCIGRKSDLRSAATNTSFRVSKKDNFRNKGTEVRASSKSLPMRESYKEEIWGREKEETLLMPKIVYNSPEESSEEDELQELQGKYLANV